VLSVKVAEEVTTNRRGQSLNQSADLYYTHIQIIIR
jgi:hypothetical protein